MAELSYLHEISEKISKLISSNKVFDKVLSTFLSCNKSDLFPNKTFFLLISSSCHLLNL